MRSSDSRNYLTFFEFIRGILAAICAKSSRSTRFIASHCVAHVKRQSHDHH